ncbi:MAG: GNAT family N-acetyltransferase [Myxococcota bacterium]
MLADLDPARVVWIGLNDESAPAPTHEPRRVRTLLGQSFDAVVLDGHDGLDPDVLGQCQGLVWGGGGLVLRLPPATELPRPQTRAHLAAHPYRAADVGVRFHHLVERALQRAPTAEVVTVPSSPPPEPLGPPPRHIEGTDDQRRVVDALHHAWSSPEPTRTVVLADRGRGKSSALGLALASLADYPQRTIAVTAAHPDAAAEVFRFAPDTHAQFVPLSKLVGGDVSPDLIVVDEAAQLPVPMLRRLVEVHPRAHLAFATTTHGYEGTGRGFVLRFLTWLETREPPVQRLSLRTPIRWSDDDPLERLVFDALLLDADLAPLPADLLRAPDAELRTERLDRNALLTDEPSLRELFGLLVHAHYRTTPTDLHRLLDAPNLAVHVVRWRDHIVAATIVAEEGALSPAQCQSMARGQIRIRAHALPDALVAHLGHPEAGELPMLRSVRIATHPKLRRQRLATRLVEHVHAQATPALFGTLFGATPSLLAFRRSLGYRLVRISASRGARTGEPSVLMLRPTTPRAEALVNTLRAELARDLPRQLELMQADRETLLDPALITALHHDLPTPAPLSPQQCDALVRTYAPGPRTFESIALALQQFIKANPHRLTRLPPSDQALIQSRVLAAQSWHHATQSAALPSIPAAMRALRRATRHLLDP